MALRPGDVRRLALIGLAVAASYVLAARLGFRFAMSAEQVTTVWAPTGIGIAALLLWGHSLWPAVWVGAFVANAFSAAPLWTAAAVATGNTLEAATAAWILIRIAHVDPRLQRIRDCLWFIVGGAALSPTVSATIGVTTLCWSREQPWDEFARLWRDWYLGDVVGALVVGPLILTMLRRRSWSAREALLAAGLVAGAIVTTQLVFGRAFGSANAPHPLEYIVFPFVVAAAVSCAQPVTSMVVLSTSAVAIWNTAHGAGPFAGTAVHESLVQLQVFIGVLAGTGLLLASAITERTMGERRRGAAHAVGEVLARATDFESAAPDVLHVICQNLEWQMGVLWLVDDDDRHLRCLAVWSEPSLPAASFAAKSRNLVFPLGVGLPGRVLATGAAAWIENVDRDPNFPRADVAREAGVHGAFAFPIRLAGRIEAAIEFFNRSAVPPDPDLLRTMSTVGNQIGQFIGRKRQETAVAAAARERAQLLRREAAARGDAEAANRAKDQFLATLSHELRTPLNAILGWTRMLRDRTIDPKDTQRALEVIDRNAQLQAQLIEDILDVSRIITGGLQLSRQCVDLRTVIGAALDAVRPAATAKGVELIWPEALAPVLVDGDAKRLEQAVWNLLVNAVKFTEAGGSVRVGMTTIDDRIRITVTDDGIGIDSQFLPHIFERFRQADASASREKGGLGIGLAIVEHLIVLHGGRVHAESPGIGMGATFTIELTGIASPERLLP